MHILEPHISHQEENSAYDTEKLEPYNMQLRQVINGAESGPLNPDHFTSIQTIHVPRGERAGTLKNSFMMER